MVATLEVHGNKRKTWLSNSKRSCLCRRNILYLDCVSNRILVVVLSNKFVICYYWGKLGKEYTGSLRVLFTTAYEPMMTSKLLISNDNSLASKFNENKEKRIFVIFIVSCPQSPTAGKCPSFLCSIPKPIICGYIQYYALSAPQYKSIYSLTEKGIIEKPNTSLKLEIISKSL